MKQLTTLCTILFLLIASYAISADVTAYHPRQGESGRAPDSIIVIPAQSFVIGAAETSDNFTLEGNGKIHSYTITLPNYTNAVTGTLSIADADGYEIYSKASIAKNTSTNVYNLGDVIPIYGTVTVTLTLSGVPGGSGGTATIKMRME